MVKTMEEEYSCKCCTKHIPLPHRLSSITVGNSDVYLCPTSKSNLEVLLEEYERYDGRPPGFVRKHFSDYLQFLAMEIWNERVRNR